MWLLKIFAIINPIGILLSAALAELSMMNQVDTAGCQSLWMNNHWDLLLPFHVIGSDEISSHASF